MKRKTKARPLGIDQIHCGDALELLPKIPTKIVRLIHTSPPYNIGRNYSAYEDSISRRDYLSFISNIVDECYRVLMPGGSLFWQTGYTFEKESTAYIYPLDHLTFRLFLEAGFRLKDRIVWRYFGGMAFKRKFTNKHETILWWVKPGADTTFDVSAVRERSKGYDARNNLFGRNPGNVWEIDRVAYGSTEQSSHIAVFPDELSERIVLSASRPGDICLDPFSGSGTLCKVAKSRGRQFIGIEIDPKYANESRVRLDFFQSNEFDNVLSQVLKDRVFQMEKTSLTVNNAIEKLQLLLRQQFRLPAELLNATDYEAIAAFRGSHVPKTRMVTVWKRLDEYMESPECANDPLRIVDTAFLSCYRYNRVYNSVMRFALAQRWLHQYHELTTDHRELETHLWKLFKNEPSSYVAHGELVSLSFLNRDIKAASAQEIRTEDPKLTQLDLTI